MITFKQLLDKAKEKGYKPRMPEFGDEHLRPVPEGSRIQQVELAAITAWVVVKFKISRESEAYKNLVELPFHRRVSEVYSLVDKI